MIMRPGQQLLLPANTVFIWVSLFVSFFFNIFQNLVLWGRAAWAPDLVALVLVFWAVHQPRRVGIAVAFFFGLLMDVHEGSVLGQHALAYSVLNYLAVAVHRRLLWFPVPLQAVQVFPLMLCAHAVALIVRMLAGNAFYGYSIILAPVLEALLWPVVSVILLIPQTRSPDPDANRPL
jgi:rod shape-determining protein MreD